MSQLPEEIKVTEDINSLRRRLDHVMTDGIHDHNERLKTLQDGLNDLTSRLIRIEERMNHADTVLVERVARAAVAEVFRNSGVNVDNPNELDEFRENLRFNSTLRAWVKRAAWGVGGTMISIIMMLLWVIVRGRAGMGEGS